MRSIIRDRAITAGFVAAGALVGALLLVLPGQTVVSVYVNDLFIFLDGAHRIASGQVPNRDFHTALGPLNFYLPAAGYRLSGSLGLAMPVAMALWLGLLVLPMAWVLASRLRPVLALPFAAFLLAAAAAPINLGEAISALTFAMFYNRIGWVALALLALMALEPRHPVRRRVAGDGLSAALLTLLLFYSKASYGAVALGFIGLLLLWRPHRPAAALALALVVATGGLIEIAWGGTAAHVADLRTAGRVSGRWVGGIGELFDVAMRNFADYVLLAFLAGWHAWRERDGRLALFYAYCAGAGAAIMTQNAQTWGILTLHAGAVVAAEGLLRTAPAGPSDRPWHVGAGVPLLALVVLLPATVHNAAALVLHAALAVERPVSRFALPNLDRIRIVDLWPVTDYGFSVAYRDGLDAGARALSGLRPERVMVLDFANGFSAGLGLPPPRGDSAWLHWGRNLDHRHHVPGDRLLADVAFVMVPKPGINGPQLWEIYGDAVEAAFDLVRETPSWRVYRRRGAPTAVGDAG